MERLFYQQFMMMESISYILEALTILLLLELDLIANGFLLALI